MTRTDGRRLPRSTLAAMLHRIDGGVNNTQIYNQTGVTQRCTAKKRQNLQAWGQLYAPATVKVRRLSTLCEFHRRRLCKYLNSKPHAYLEEIRD